VSFLAPGFLLASAVAACGVIALHFIVTRRPRSVSFPTARFVPDVPIAARSRSIQFSDLVLLAVRVLTILAAGAALAKPVFTPPREKIVRVIMADVSGSVASLSEVRDSARSLFRAGDAIIAFDTSAWALGSPDSIGGVGRTALRGSLSAGLAAALSSGSRVRQGADSVELVIVSPVAGDEKDRATGAIRAQWRGRGRVVHVAPAVSRSQPATVSRSSSGSRPAFAVARRRVDTVGGVVADGNVMIAPFERRWRYIADSLSHARVIARWVDGEPAAIERDSAAACMRSLAIPMDSTGDMPLRPSTIRFVASLDAPCQQGTGTTDSTVSNMLAGGGRLARSGEFPPASDIDSPLARWLAAIAIILAIADMVLRRPREGDSDR
jgi:aerotolerance regulator-like protein